MYADEYMDSECSPNLNTGNKMPPYAHEDAKKPDYGASPSNKKHTKSSDEVADLEPKFRSPWELVQNKKTMPEMKSIVAKDMSLHQPSDEKKPSPAGNKDLKSPWQPVWKYNFPHLLMEDTQLDRIIELPKTKHGGKTFQVIPRRRRSESPSPGGKRSVGNNRLGTPFVDKPVTRSEPDGNSSPKCESIWNKSRQSKTFLKDNVTKQIARRQENGHTFLQLDNNGSLESPSPKVLSYSRHFTPSPVHQHSQNESDTKKEESDFYANQYRPYHERPISTASDKSHDQEEISERTTRPNHSLKSENSYRKLSKAVNFAPSTFPRMPPPSYRESEMTDGVEDFVENNGRYFDNGGCFYPNEFGIRNPLGMSRENAFVKRQ
uniref:uncharacterized protein LOC120345506 n=1 Tax=Styela clava TaxID=7725 RepID=UPI00193A233A|nr:uncharacterized protein LOC120345506 [Styela clava]